MGNLNDALWQVDNATDEAYNLVNKIFNVSCRVKLEASNRDQFCKVKCTLSD